MRLLYYPTVIARLLRVSLESSKNDSFVHVSEIIKNRDTLTVQLSHQITKRVLEIG